MTGMRNDNEIVDVLREINKNTREIISLLKNNKKLGFWGVIERIALIIAISGLYTILVDIIQRLSGGSK